jgi:hypothetical protein
VLREGFCHREAEAARGAGDEGDTPGERKQV